MITPTQLCNLFAEHRLASATEDQLQRAIEELLSRHSISAEREFALSPQDRVDFMIGGIALEVKIKGSVSEVTRQLHRYAQQEAVSEILLVTTRWEHKRIASTLNGKRVIAFWIGAAAAL